jgi:adenylate cyclase
MAGKLGDLLFGRQIEGTVPARVEQAIAAQEIDSEKLIGWAQLIVGCVWTALYFAAPKSFADDSMFEPVPVALACYLAFSMLRLVLVYRRIAPRWLLAGSVVVDMSLLMGLIWSFHLQYDQPAAFYLKAPTLLYVFIFIALRALRFSAGYVLLAGTVAAIGWLGMLYYALNTSSAPSMGVTRDYVAYMTSNQVLIGAEFDKIITILLSTAILAVAIVRARRMLVAASVEGAAHRDLSRFFSPEVKRRITAGEARLLPGQGEIRQAAVLMTDIRGFTPLAMRTDPAELMALLADYQRHIVTEVQRHGGTVDKFMGDGMLATFGAAEPSDTPAADALRAVDGLAGTIADWQSECRESGRPVLDVGMAVAAGPVVFGAVGDDSRLELTVIGEPVNLTAKLEKSNKAESCHALTTSATLELARRQGYTPGRDIEIRRNRRIEGVAQPVDLAVLLG